MKYGRELSKRSVPEWKAHNIDYNEIKHLIKRATVPNAVPRATDDLLQLLFEELESVNLFVKSKSGEVDRRISDCRRLVSAIEKQAGHEQPAQNKLFKLHRGVSKLSHDVQSLSRFISAQRTGFRKLLKKYKKWSRSTRLSTEFLPELEAPESFANYDFTSCFLELSLLYEVVRNNGVQLAAQQSHVEALPVQPLCKFDCEMVSSVTRKKVFWVHQDNVMELQVALLKHLSLYSTDKNQGADQTSAIYLDDKQLRSIQTGKEPGQLRWVNENTGTTLLSPTGGLRHFTTLSLSQSQLDAVLNGNVDTESWQLSTTGKLALGWVERRNAVPMSKFTCKRTRYLYNDEMGEPSSSVSNRDVPFVWASLDNDIWMTREGTSCTDASAEEASDARNFPHAVLEIRWKGMSEKPAWLAELESSHLVTPVPEFSIFAHTVAVFHQDALQHLPSWLTMIENEVDIRKTPKRTKASAETTAVPRAAQPQPQPQTQPQTANHPSILLNDSQLPPPLDETRSDDSNSAASSLGKHDDSALLNSSHSKPVVRYWNEFDDPEEGEDYYNTNNGAGVFVFPDEDDDEDKQSGGLLSSDNVDSLVRISDRFVRGVSRRLGWNDDGAYQQRRRPSQVISDEESLERAANASETTSLISASFKPKYHSTEDDVEALTGSYPHEYAVKRRDMILTVLYCGCFFIASLIICILFGVLMGEQHTAKHNMAVFVFVVTGLLFALAVGILAMCLFLLREIPPLWWHQTLVLATFFSIVCFGVGGIASVFDL